MKQPQLKRCETVNYTLAGRQVFDNTRPRPDRELNSAAFKTPGGGLHGHYMAVCRRLFGLDGVVARFPSRNNSTAAPSSVSKGGERLRPRPSSSISPACSTRVQQPSPCWRCPVSPVAGDRGDHRRDSCCLLGKGRDEPPHLKAGTFPRSMFPQIFSLSPISTTSSNYRSARPSLSS